MIEMNYIFLLNNRHYIDNYKYKFTRKNKYYCIKYDCMGKCVYTCQGINKSLYIKSDDLKARVN